VSKTYSFNVADQLADLVEKEADKKHCTKTDVLVEAVREHFQHQRQRAGVESIERWLEELLFEVVKNRAVLRRLMMREGMGREEEEMARLLEEAQADAEAYVREKRGEK
jgi:predicted transcriptional regulator